MLKWAFVLLTFTATTSVDAKIIGFSGSAREDSINQKLVEEAAFLAQQKGVNVEVINLKDYEMPFYNADLETKNGMPEKAKAFRNQLKLSNIIIIASPEYNGSLTAVLKNAIDWSSRSEEGGGSREAFKDKKFILLATSPGGSGGSAGLKHLSDIITRLGGVVIEQVTVPNASQAFDSAGHLKDEGIKNKIISAIQTSQ